MLRQAVKMLGKSALVVGLALLPAAIVLCGAGQGGVCAALSGGPASVRLAYADDAGLTISPTKLDLGLAAGKTHESSFTVINNSAGSAMISVYATPFGVSDESYQDIDFTTQTAYTELSAWIKFPQSIYSFKGHQQRKIKFEVSTPRGAAPGGQYAALFAQIDPPAAKADQSGIVAARRVGCLVYGEVAGQVETAGKVSFDPVPTWHFGGDLVLPFRVQNTGNTDFDTTYQLTAAPLFLGQAFDTLDTHGEAYADPANPPVAIHNILPGTTRAISQTWVDPAPGVYQVAELVDFLGQHRVQAVQVVVCPIWLVISTGALVIILVGLVSALIIIRHRRKQRSLICPARHAT